MSVLLEIYCSLQQWKNFANPPRIGKVIAMVRVAPFFDSRCRMVKLTCKFPTIYNVSLIVLKHYLYWKNNKALVYLAALYHIQVDNFLSVRHMLHGVSKKSHLWLAIILTHMNGFWYFLAEMLPIKSAIKKRFTMLSQITCASALPDKTGKHENHIFSLKCCISRERWSS